MIIKCMIYHTWSYDSFGNVVNQQLAAVKNHSPGVIPYNNKYLFLASTIPNQPLVIFYPKTSLWSKFSDQTMSKMKRLSRLHETMFNYHSTQNFLWGSTKIEIDFLRPENGLMSKYGYKFEKSVLVEKNHWWEKVTSSSILPFPEHITANGNICNSCMSPNLVPLPDQKSWFSHVVLTSNIHVDPYILTDLDPEAPYHSTLILAGIFWPFSFLEKQLFSLKDLYP